MLDKIKLSLRISHNLLDDEILETIETARMEMNRAGISLSKVNDEDDNLIVNSIKTYCKAEYESDDKKSEKYMESFKYQLDNLRKSGDYV